MVMAPAGSNTQGDEDAGRPLREPFALLRRHLGAIEARFLTIGGEGRRLGGTVDLSIGASKSTQFISA